MVRIRRPNQIVSEEFKKHLRHGFKAYHLRKSQEDDNLSMETIEDEFAELVGLTRSSIQKYKGGSVPPDHTVTRKIAEKIAKGTDLGAKWCKSILSASSDPDVDGFMQMAFGDARMGLAPTVNESANRHAVLHNLPNQAGDVSYQSFIPREELFQGLYQAIAETQRRTVVCVEGFGGMGKSTLVLEFVYEYISTEACYHKHAIWISDRGKEQRTTLKTVMSTIERELDVKARDDLQGIDQDKLVRNIREMAVLLIVDNYETISDPSLAKWLLALPRPCKVIVTARKNSDQFKDEVCTVEVAGMEPAQAKSLIESLLDSLRIPKGFITDPHIDSLIEVSDGNPLIIGQLLGLIKRRGSSDQVIEDFKSAKGPVFEKQFDNLFDAAWKTILEHPNARKLALAMSFFRVDASGTALRYVSDIPEVLDSGLPSPLSELDIAMEWLIDLKFLEPVWTLENKRRYFQLSLVRTFMRKVIEEEDTPYLHNARERWVDWYIRFASGIGFCWNDHSRLKPFDLESEHENVNAVIEWCQTNGHHEAVLSIARDLRYYHYVRGNWSEDESLIPQWLDAANKLENSEEEFDARVYAINIASKKGDRDVVEAHLPRVQAILDKTKLSNQRLADFRHAEALYLRMIGKNADALERWQANLTNANLLTAQSLNANLRWSAVCKMELGHVGEARKDFEKLLEDSISNEFDRGIIFASIQLAEIVRVTDTDRSSLILDSAEPYVDKVDDAMLRGQYFSARASVHEARREIQQALDAVIRARDIFKRIGCNRSYAEASVRLERLQSSQTVPAISSES